MPNYQRPIVHRSNGYASVELHDHHDLGVSVTVRFLDPLEPSDKSVRDERIFKEAKLHLEAALATLSDQK